MTESAKVTAPSHGPRRLSVQQWVAVGLMLLSLGLAYALKPSALWADKAGLPDLESIVPHGFGDWVESPYGAQSIVDPQQQEMLRDIYTSTLARVYIHKPTGRRVMLSIAYGKDQTRDTQLHVPERCYRAQGFRIDRSMPEGVRVASATLPVTRMETSMGPRVEQVTYWVRMGEMLARGSLQYNLVRMKYAARGYIVDGLLFRVSEVTRLPAAESFQLQDRFVSEMLTGMPPSAQAELIGSRAL